MEAVANSYAHGRGVDQDMLTALSWLIKSSEAGHYAVIQTDSNKDNKQFTDSINHAEEFFRRQAESGDSTSQVKLGYMYYTLLISSQGSQVSNLEDSMAQAKGWFLRAAENGNTAAQILLGNMSNQYIFVSERPNPEEALKWFQMAAGKNNAYAQYSLAIIYRNNSDIKYPVSKSIPKNINQAEEWALKSANQGFSLAQTLLGVLLLEKGNSDAEALAWLQKSANQSDPHAFVLIGDIYANGRGVPKNFVQAITWYRKAIDEFNSQTAYARLGQVYEDGLGVPKDNVQAVRYYENAVDGIGLGNVIHVKLAHMYEHGIGTSVDGSKAILHYTLAAIGGDVESMKILQKINENGLLNSPINLESAQHWKEAIIKAEGSK